MKASNLEEALEHVGDDSTSPRRGAPLGERLHRCIATSIATSEEIRSQSAATVADESGRSDYSSRLRSAWLRDRGRRARRAERSVARTGARARRRCTGRLAVMANARGWWPRSTSACGKGDLPRARELLEAELEANAPRGTRVLPRPRSNRDLVEVEWRAGRLGAAPSDTSTTLDELAGYGDQTVGRAVALVPRGAPGSLLRGEHRRMRGVCWREGRSAAPRRCIWPHNAAMNRWASRVHRAFAWRARRAPGEALQEVAGLQPSPHVFELQRRRCSCGLGRGLSRRSARLEAGRGACLRGSRTRASAEHLWAAPGCATMPRPAAARARATAPKRSTRRRGSVRRVRGSRFRARPRSCTARRRRGAPPRGRAAPRCREARGSEHRLRRAGSGSVGGAGSEGAETGEAAPAARSRVDERRAAGGDARRGREEESRGCGAAVHDGRDRRGSLDPDLPQARRPFAHRARATRRRRRGLALRRVESYRVSR